MNKSYRTTRWPIKKSEKKKTPIFVDRQKITWCILQNFTYNVAAIYSQETDSYRPLQKIVDAVAADVIIWWTDNYGVNSPGV